MKKILATLTLAASILTVSCAEPATLMEFLPENSGETDFGGTTISWAWSKGNSSQAFYEQNTPQYDILINRINSIETELNLDIEPIIEEDKVNMEAIKIKMMSGTPSHDIITAGSVSDYAEGGLIYSLSNFSDYIDLNDTLKFGPKTAQEGYMHKGEIYALSPVQWPGFEPMGGYVIAYNRDLFKDNGLTDLHEYYENEIWTYDTFENEYIAKTNVYDGDGNLMEVFLTHESNLYQALIHSNQVKFIKKEPDGTLVADPYSKSFVNALTWGENLVDNHREKINFEDTWHIESYRKGLNLSTITYTNSFTTGNIAYNDLATFESGIMPFPCGPDATYGEWTSCVVHIYGFMIPITSSHAEAAAMTIDRLAEPFDEFGGDDGLLEFYKSNIFMNELDAEIFVELAREPIYTYANVAGGLGEDVRQGFQDVLYSSQTSVTTGMEKFRSILTELIEEWMIPNYNTVYGE